MKVLLGDQIEMKLKSLWIQKLPLQWMDESDTDDLQKEHVERERTR